MYLNDYQLQHSNNNMQNIIKHLQILVKSKQLLITQEGFDTLIRVILDEGIDYIKDVAYRDGFNDGQDSVNHEKFDEGYSDGYNDGYAQGYSDSETSHSQNQTNKKY